MVICLIWFVKRQLETRFCFSKRNTIDSPKKFGNFESPINLHIQANCKLLIILRVQIIICKLSNENIRENSFNYLENVANTKNIQNFNISSLVIGIIKQKLILLPKKKKSKSLYNSVFPRFVIKLLLFCRLTITMMMIMLRIYPTHFNRWQNRRPLERGYNENTYLLYSMLKVYGKN